MGLDMYLNATKWLPCHYGKDEKKEVVSVTIKGKTFSSDKGFNDIGRLDTIHCTGIYWRKANAIHKWFVDNTQGGEDNCRSSDVSREQIIELREVCKKVLANKELAKELLPPQEGFFFGTYELDEWYWGTIKDTITEIDELLEFFDESWDFEYRASW